MDKTKSSSNRRHDNSKSISVGLSSAFLEWVLILMLYMQGMFSYVVTRFAQYFELETPCLLCSRLDHVFQNEKHGFYWDLICKNHKLEISCLVYCYEHDKLIDVHRMCESCLFSFATMNKSNAETYILLVDKFSPEPHSFGQSSKLHYSCCSKLCTSKGREGFHSDLNGFDAFEFSLPLPSSISRVDLEKLKEKSYETVYPIRVENQEFDPISHVGYRELKATSDSESDIPLPNDRDDNISVMVGEPDVVSDFFQNNYAHTESQNITLMDNLITENSPLVSETVDTNEYFENNAVHTEPYNSTLTYDMISMNPLLDLEAQEVVIEPKASFHILEELTSNNSLGNKPDADLSFKTDSISHTSPPCSATEPGIEVLPGRITNELGKTYTNETVKICETENRSITIIEPTIANDSQISDNFELGDDYKLGICNSERPPFGKCSGRVNDDLKLLLSNLPCSPIVSMNSDDLKFFDPLSSTGLHTLQKRISLERNFSGFESLDGSVVSEIEGESLVDRLKRQADHDKKSLGTLYKELDEERNASAISTSQAMAMINRLQEEKAALHMEALQYLRMMEEQAEYDMEALQKVNDKLSEKEKEIQDLEEELEFYKTKFLNESMYEVNDIEGSCVLLGLEDEGLYILQSLRNLEKKLELLSNDGVCFDFSNGEDIGNESDVGNLSTEAKIKRGDLAAIGIEVSNLNIRLKTLEADRSFLQNTINSLQKGDKGLQFVQEIVHRLRDLQRTRSVS